MTECEDKFSFHIRVYDEPGYGFRKLRGNRFAIDLGWFSLIFELWFLRR